VRCLPSLLHFFATDGDFCVVDCQLSIGGKICLRFFATDGKKLTPSHNHCQTQYKKTAKKSAACCAKILQMLFKCLSFNVFYVYLQASGLKRAA
jgi:hypothetical protein